MVRIRMDALRRPRTLAHDLLHGGVRWTARRLGYEILWPTFYNGIPRFAELPPGFWTGKATMPAVRLYAADGLRYVEQELRPHLAEFAPPRQGGPGTYHVPNGSYDEADGALLWAMIRRHRPRRVLELGSGHSSLLIRDALLRNASDGHAGLHLVVDPFPLGDVIGEPGPAIELRRISATELPAAEYEGLEAGDVVFVDTTHTVKVGSEVNHIFLEGLPRLRPGVLVHVHDVFLPWEYPRPLVEGLGYHWAEQYLLHAFLAFNDAFEVLVPAHLLLRTRRAELERLLPLPPREASAFWMRRAERPAS